MKKSARAMRMQRHHKRMGKDSKLSLVSLMDIFTILVFFLMVNASDVQVLQNNKSVELPKSNANQAAKETLVLMVSASDLLVQGRKLADVSEILSQVDDIIPELADELAYQSKRSEQIFTQPTVEGAQPQPLGRAITIMGDRTIPYALLKRIMQTCAQGGYTNISLAVDSTEAQQSDETQQNAEPDAQETAV